MRRLLHVGCGPKGRPVPLQFAGYTEIRYDIDPAVEPDMIGTLTQIRLPDASIDGVYACHVIEHLEPWEIDPALAELYRVLNPGGQAVIIAPDLAAWAQMIVDEPATVEDVREIPFSGNISILDALYGFQPDVRAGRDGMRHRTMFTRETLAKHLLQAGFVGRIMAQALQLYAVVAKEA